MAVTPASDGDGTVRPAGAPIGVGLEICGGLGRAIGATTGAGAEIGVRTVTIGAAVLSPMPAAALTLVMAANTVPAATNATALAINFFTLCYPVRRRRLWPFRQTYGQECHTVR